MHSKNKTRYVILGLLSEGPLSGYEVKKLVTIRFSGFWSESYGQIYPELKKLEAGGLVTKTSTGNTRTRYVYSITGEGFAALRSWLQEPVEKELVRLEILLKLYFGSLIKPENLQGHIQNFRNEHLQYLNLLGRFETELRSITDEHENHPFVLMTILFGQKVNQAYLEWSDQVLELLKKRQR